MYKYMAISCILISTILVSCSLISTEIATVSPSPYVDQVPSISKLELFDEIFEAIIEGYIYEDFDGSGWEITAEQFRDTILSGKSDEDFYSGLIALVDSLPDVGSNFQTREERIASELEASSSYEGIGAFVAFREHPTPRIILLSVMEGSPAEEAGLQAHDAIYFIDGEPILAEQGLGVVERIRGPEGTNVVIKIASPGGDLKEVTVTRGRQVASDIVKGGVLTSGDGYLLVPVMADEGLPETLIGILQMQEEREITAGLIIDFRIAHTGSNWPLEELLAMFADGEVGSFYNRFERNTVSIEGQDISGSQSIPLTILIGPDTSGSPEILAGALQTTGRAILIGMQTKGQVFGYQRIRLPDGSQLTFASSSFETIQGDDLGKSGLSPDILVGADWDQVSEAYDPMILAAISILGTIPESQIN